MKNLIVVLLVSFGVSFAWALVETPADTSFITKVNKEDLKELESQIIQLALETPVELSKAGLNWKIGDGMNFSILAKGVAIGTMTWKLAAETQKDLIVTQTITLFKQSISTEFYHDKITGALNSMSYGGVQIPMPSKSDTVLAKGEEQVVVGAGIYTANYLKTEDARKTQRESWINTTELPLKGWVKVKTTHKNIDMTFELVSYAKMR